MQLIFDVFVLLAYLVAIPMFFLAPWLVSLVLGTAYEPTVPIFQIQMTTFFFVCISAVKNRWLIAENLLSLSVAFAVIGGVINYVLNLLLIPTLGGEGAALATLVSYCMMGFLLLALVKKPEEFSAKSPFPF